MAALHVPHDVGKCGHATLSGLWVKWDVSNQSSYDLLPVSLLKCSALIANYM